MGIDIFGEVIHVRGKDLAQLFGVTARRVSQLSEDGVIKTEPAKGKGGKRYNLVETITSYINYLSNKAYDREKGELEDKLKELKLRAEIRLKESQVELHNLKTEIAAGKFISVEEVRQDYERFFVSFKKFAMAIPARVAGKIGGAVDPTEARRIESELMSEVTKLLEEFVLSAEKEDDRNKSKEN